MNEKTIKGIGWFASLMGSAMFFSYIDQIRLNISGHPGSIILPIVTAINGLAWVSYCLLRRPIDWPLVVPNALAIVLGIITAITAFI